MTPEDRKPWKVFVDKTFTNWPDEEALTILLNTVTAGTDHVIEDRELYNYHNVVPANQQTMNETLFLSNFGHSVRSRRDFLYQGDVELSPSGAVRQGVDCWRNLKKDLQGSLKGLEDIKDTQIKSALQEGTDMLDCALTAFEKKYDLKWPEPAATGGEAHWLDPSPSTAPPESQEASQRTEV